MADANSVSPGLATLGAGGWTVTEPSAGGRFGSVGVLTPQQTLAIQALVSGAWIPANTTDVTAITAAAQAAMLGSVTAQSQSGLFVPYSIATWGDSRVDIASGSTPKVAGSTTLRDTRGATWAVAMLNDCELTHNFGYSGDLSANWASTSRSAGKTYSAMAASSADLVIVQYGVNDAQALTPAATIIGYLQAVCTEIMKAGKRLVFESVEPVGPGVGSYAAVQAIIDAVNASMQLWIAQFPSVARYADTTSVLKLAASGTANPVYFNGGMHTNRYGAQACAPVIAACVRQLLAQRVGAYPARNNAPNLVNLAAPSMFAPVETGTVTGMTMTSGADSRGQYVEYSWTPATFVSGECRVRLELSANFYASVTPYYSLSGAELLQGGAVIYADDGAGGAPNAYTIAMRQRFYTASVFSEVGVIPQGAPSADTPDYTGGAFVYRMTTPAMQNSAASVSGVSAQGSGYQLTVFVSSQRIAPVRVRLYSPYLRVVGYSPNPVSVTPPASAAAYTNSSLASQQVTLIGGTVSAVSVNGVALTGASLATGQTLTVTLAPGDTLTPTYSVAPAMYVRHL